MEAPVKPSEKTFLLPETVFVAIVQYLENKPYREVAEGLLALSQLKIHNEVN